MQDLGKGAGVDWSLSWCKAWGRCWKVTTGDLSCADISAAGSVGWWQNCCAQISAAGNRCGDVRASEHYGIQCCRQGTAPKPIKYAAVHDTRGCKLLGSLPLTCSRWPHGTACSASGAPLLRRSSCRGALSQQPCAGQPRMRCCRLPQPPAPSCLRRRAARGRRPGAPASPPGSQLWLHLRCHSAQQNAAAVAQHCRQRSHSPQLQSALELLLLLPQYSHCALQCGAAPFHSCLWPAHLPPPSTVPPALPTAYHHSD